MTSPPFPGQSGAFPGQPRPSSKAPWLLVVGVVAVVALVGVLFLMSRDSGGLPQGIRHDGLVMANVGDGPSGEPEEAWATDIECVSLCSSAVAGPVVVVGETSDSGSTLVGLDTATGDEVWSERFSVDQVSNLTVVDGVLLATTNFHDGELIAFDPASGDELWAMPQVSGLYYGDGMLVVGNYASDSVDREFDASEVTGEAMAVDLETGEELWDVPGTPVGVCGNTAVLGDGDRVVAVDLGSGEERWSERVDPGTVVCSPDAVHVVSDDELVAFDLQSGEERWSERGHDGVVSMSVVEDVLVVDGDGDVAAVNITDGEELWAVDREEWEMYGLLPVGGGRGLGSGGDRARLIDLASGEEVASIRIGDLVSTALGRSSILVLDGDELSSYDLGELDERWSIDVPEEGQAMAVTDDAVFVLFDDEIVSYR